MAWSFVGVSSVVESTGTTITLTEPAGCQPGDLLVACIAYRIGSTTPINAATHWRLVNQRNNNNVLTTTSAASSAYMAYCIRGNSQPYSVFDFPVAASVALGRIIVYRDVDMLSPYDTSTAFTTATAITAVSGTGLTTSFANDLIVMLAAGGQEASWSTFDAVTNPTTASGTGGQTGAPTVGTWLERADSITTTGADTSLGIADAIRGTAGATGNLTVTASTGAAHSVVAGAFKMGPTPGLATPAGSPSAITKTGSTLNFPDVNGNSGTVSSTITVPSDAQMVVVGLIGWSADANYFSNMTFTKGGVDTAMTRAGPTEPGAEWTSAIFYLALPDTGANKSLKFDWAGTNAPGTLPLISVTFWKGIDTASPVRSVGSSRENKGASVTGTLTAQTGDLVVGFVGGDGSISGASFDLGYNLNVLENLTAAGSGSDGAWGTFSPSGNLAVGALAATNLDWMCCAAIVLKPAPSPLKGFAVNGASSGTTVTTTIPATASGDCIIVAGLTQGISPKPPITITAGGQSVVFGKLGGLETPRYSDASGGLYNFVGIIVNPTPGTTSVVLANGHDGQHELGCWVVSGLTNPVQDIGIWVPYHIGSLNVSGLSATLAVASEFAVSFNMAADNTTSINTSQPGSSGFTANATGTALFGSGYSYQVTTATTPLQAAWDVSTNGGNCLLATYRSTPPAAPTAPPISFVGFAARSIEDFSFRLDFPPFTATQSGDCIIFAGVVSGSIAGLVVQTPTGETGVFGTLGGVTSPVLSGSSYNFVGIIANPRVGTDYIEIITTNSNLKKLAAWVVRGLTIPQQDKGVWTINADIPIVVSGLTGTLADANEFAVSVARPNNQVLSANIEQTGSAGFLLDRLSATYDGGYSHQITESTSSIQAAWNNTSGACDVTLATYRSAPAAVPGTTSIAQTGSKTDFALSSAANSGTVSSTITVPSDAQIVVVGVNGWSADANYFDSMTFTKGGADTAMTRVGTPEPGNGITSAIFYLVLPDTGTNKSLKFNWAGTNAPGESPVVSVTFWKGIDTAAPVRSGAASPAGFSSQVYCYTDTLTAQDGDRVIAFAGADNLGSDGTADSWINLSTLAQCTKSADRHDGAWATFAPSANLQVGLATATGWQYGAIAAIVLKPGAATPTGTLATTEAADTAAMAGNVARLAALATTEAIDTTLMNGAVRWTATLATSEAPDTAAINATVRWPATLATTEAADAGVALGSVRWAATLAVTEGADTALINGLVFTPVSGTLTTTEAADVAAIAGTVVSPATGTLATTEAADASAIIGGIYGSGTLATTEAVDVAAMAGAVRWAATLATAEAPDTAAMVGAVRWNVVLAASEAPDVAALVGSVRWTATLAASEAADAAAFLGATRWLATLATTEAPDTASLAGGIYGTGTLATGEAPDVAAFAVTARILATLAATEAPDGAVLVGGIYGTGTLSTREAADTVQLYGSIVGAGLAGNLAVIEPPDTAVMLGTVSGVAGVVAASEAADTAALTGAVRWAAILAASEAPDTANFAATARTLGTLAATEAADAAAFAVTARTLGTLATGEAPDTASVAGAVTWLGTLETSELADTAAFLGDVTWVPAIGPLAATEAPDSVEIIVQFVSGLVLATTEAPDRARFSAAPPYIHEVEGRILGRDHRRVRLLANGYGQRIRKLINISGGRYAYVRRIRTLEEV